MLASKMKGTLASLERTKVGKCGEIEKGAPQLVVGGPASKEGKKKHLSL